MTETVQNLETMKDESLETGTSGLILRPRLNGRPFKKGQSGNPKGRPPMTHEMRNALEMIKSLAPKAAKTMEELLDREDVKPAVKVRICEIILERTYGKPEASIKLTSVNQSVAQSRKYVLDLVETVRQFHLVEQIQEGNQT